MGVRVQAQAFDAGAELNLFTGGRVNAGAIVSFSGIVRDDSGHMREMVIEHYPGMTEKAISAMRDDAVGRWGLADALVIHRHGVLKPGEQIMMVITAARHRADAFGAADYLMDYLKSRAPFWKKEITGDGADWVAAKVVDEDALKRW